MESFAYEPDDTDMELRTFVIAIEFISQSGDHIFDSWLSWSLANSSGRGKLALERIIYFVNDFV